MSAPTPVKPEMDAYDRAFWLVGWLTFTGLASGVVFGFWRWLLVGGAS